MSLVLGAALGGLLAFGGWRLWVLSRSVRRICHHLDDRASAKLDAKLDAQMEQFWRDVCRLQERHARALTARQDDLDDRLRGIEPWVRHLAAAASRDPG